MTTDTAKSSLLSCGAAEPFAEVVQNHSNQLGESVALIEVKECKKANGIYEPHCETYSGKPVWRRREGAGPSYIFYNSQKQAWFLNAKLSKDSGFASISSTAAEPPLGSWNRTGTATLVTHEPAVENIKAIAAPANSDTLAGDATSDAIEVRECKKANGVYKLQLELHNAKQLWRRTTGGACFIFFSANKQAWYVNNKLGDQGYASVTSTADTPPLGRWDCSGLAVLVPKRAESDVVNTEYTITLDSPDAASHQFKNLWQKVCRQFAAESQQKCDLQDLAEMVECIVTDAEGSGFTQFGLPDPDSEIAELEFPLKIHLRFPGPGAKRVKPADNLRFMPAGEGRLAARASPGSGVMKTWVEAGATWVVTLLRSDEPAFEKVHRQACTLLDEGSLKGWLHLPLSGGARCMDLSQKRRGKCLEAEDQQSLMRMKDIAKLVQRGESVIVHCAAGMHRTGIACYMTWRLLGQSPEDTLESILKSRPVTHAEVTKNTKRHQPLCELAEKVLSDQGA